MTPIRSRFRPNRRDDLVDLRAQPAPPLDAVFAPVVSQLQRPAGPFDDHRADVACPCVVVARTPDTVRQEARDDTPWTAMQSETCRDTMRTLWLEDRTFMGVGELAGYVGLSPLRVWQFINKGNYNTLQVRMLRALVRALGWDIEVMAVKGGRRLPLILPTDAYHPPAPHAKVE